jgi:glycine/D-amino acid oxidase-like deaminating enzyme
VTSPIEYPVQDSYWGVAEPDPELSLTADVDADVVVVGGGIAGMSSAYYLKRAEASLDVVLVEQRYLGYGPSGRNFGNVPNLARQAMDLLLETIGEEGTRFVVRHQMKMMDDYENFLRDEGIACEFQHSNLLLMATSPEQRASLVELAETHRRYGYPSCLLTQEEMRDEIARPSFGGLSCGSNGYQNPFQLCRGFRAAVLKSSVRVFEGARVEHFQRSGDWIYLSAGGRQIRARQAIFATNGYTSLIQPSPGPVMSTYDRVLATEPLTEAQRRSLGLGRHRVISEAGVYGASYYFQLRPEGSLLFGGGTMPPPISGRLYPHAEHADYARIHSAFRERFPQLADVRIACAWGGPPGTTDSRLPIMAEVQPGVYLDAGFNYRGALIGAMSGKIMVGLLLGASRVDAEYRRFGELVCRLPVPRAERVG